jgi:hypothetical protein
MGLNKNVLFIICVVLGVGVGIALATWRFNDPDVVLGARLLFGLVGAVIGGTVSRWIATRNAVSS